MKIDSYIFTEKGPRNDNQDSLDLFQDSSVFTACIADGVGGSSCGKIASHDAVEYFINSVKFGSRNLSEIVRKIHENIVNFQIINSECKGMATTLSGIVIIDNLLLGVHVGDSRVYILRGNGIIQLSEDHTEVVRLFKEGLLERDDMRNYPRRNVLESALGGSRPLRIQLFNFDLHLGDRILLTSDGVHDHFSKVDFRDLSKQSPSINDLGNRITFILKGKKLTDNASFILASIE